MVYHTNSLQRSHPEHWNTYRPAYDANAPHQGPPTRPPLGFEHQIYNAPAFPHGQGLRTSPAVRADTNPNRITLTARPRSTPTNAAPVLSAHHSLWPASLDDLMGRTSRAYDLVINYQRDSAGGTRWNADGIERVFIAGRFLHGDIRVLRHWKRQVVEYGGADEEMMRKIEEDVGKVRDLCEKVQSVIEETEKKPAWPVERAGRWEENMEKQEDGYGVAYADEGRQRRSCSPSAYRSADRSRASSRHNHGTVDAQEEETAIMPIEMTMRPKRGTTSYATRRFVW